MKENQASPDASERPVALLIGPRITRNPRIAKDLRKDGLQVLTAEWAWEALDIYRFVGARVSVVFVDAQLPGDDPQAVVVALHRLDPRVRTMLVSERHRARARPGLSECG